LVACDTSPSERSPAAGGHASERRRGGDHALLDAGFDLRRTREGPTPGGSTRQATAAHLGELLGAAGDAVQPGRRIATLRREAGVGPAIAFMTPGRGRAPV
jgi:hypothetical protein